MVNEPSVFEPSKFYCIYILGVLTEKPYGKSFERNVVYIPITKLKSHHVCDVKIKMTLYHLMGRRRCSAVRRKNACKRSTCTTSFLVLSVRKIFRQDID